MSESFVLSETAADLPFDNRSVESPRKVLVISSTFPSSVMPNYGVFVKERMKAVANLPGYEVRVISPVPYFPPIRQFKKWYKWSQFPREEVVDGLKVYRPRYFLPPKIGGYFHPQLMYPAVKRTVEKIRKEFDFDLIDSHFFYPSGCVAAKLGERYERPVVITGRGEDILSFPDYPFKGKVIRQAIAKSDHFIALSNEIANAIEKNGGSPRKITRIPNGLDCEKFRPIPQNEARKKLGLPEDKKIILAVGDLLELKGFHLLVDALPGLLRSQPETNLSIVGGPGRFGRDFTKEIEQRIHANHVSDQVHLAGLKPQEELNLWYSAADLLAVLSSREGSPNVVLESLACGTPIVATPVGGIPEELENSEHGILLNERTAKEAERGVLEAFQKTWNRDLIRENMETRTWENTAWAVANVFEQALCSFSVETR